MRATLVALVAIAAFGCKRSAPTPRDAAPPAATFDTIVLAGPHTPRDAHWTSDGDLLLETDSELFRFAVSAGDPNPKVIPIGEGPLHLAVARSADAAIVTNDDGDVFVVRGSEAKRIAKVKRGNYVAISDDGLVAAVSDGDDDRHRGLSFYDTDRGTLRGRTGALLAQLSPNGRFAFTRNSIMSTEGEAPTVMPLGPGIPRGWVDGRLIVSEPSAIALVDPEAKRTVRVPLTCSGDDQIDAPYKRLVRVCRDRLIVVSLDRVGLVEFPLEKASGPREEGPVLYLPDGPDIVLHVADARGSRLFRFDVAEKTAKQIDPGITFRSWHGRLTTDLYASPASPLPSPKGDAMYTLENERLVVTKRDGTEILRFGVARQPFDAWMDRRVSAHDGGLDLFVAWQISERRVVRLGPDAPEVPLPSMRSDAEGPCALQERRRLPGKELRFNDDLETGRHPPCLCSEGRCSVVPIPDHLGVIEGANDTLIAASRRMPETQLHLLALDGSPRHVVMLGRRCQHARTALDGKSVVLLCADAAPKKDSAAEMIEVSIDPPSIVRRTPIVARPHRYLFSAVSRTYLVMRNSPSTTFAAKMIEPGTGNTLAETYGWNSGGAVHFADGRVEIFGPRDVGELRVLCVRDGVARPVATCPGAVVQGRFRFD